MDIKTIPQDFIVNEIYDLESFKTKEEGKKKPYYYFILTKTNYSQIRAMERIAKVFNTSRKLVHFAGTKDKVGITKQIISVYGINENTYESNLKYFNENITDLHLEYVGKFDGRVNLGDNLGNSFEITIRNLDKETIENIKTNIKIVSENGILNYFDSQRFGYANNSHIIGKFVLKNKLEDAVFTVLTSLPKNPKENHIEFVKKITDNWDKIRNPDEELINEIMTNDAPRYLKDEVKMLKHLKKHINDFPGAFRKIHKKIRTLYVNAYQSYVFNETINELIALKKLETPTNYEQIKLVDENEFEDKLLAEITNKILKKDELHYVDFLLPSMPELKFSLNYRKTKIYPRNMKIIDEEVDEINEGKLKIMVSFDLDKGEYATNVIKQLA